MTIRKRWLVLASMAALLGAVPRDFFDRTSIKHLRPYMDTSGDTLSSLARWRLIQRHHNQHECRPWS